MRRTSLLKRANLVVAVVLLGSSFVPSTFAQIGFRFTPIVKRHDPSPNGRTFFACDNCSGEIPSNGAFNNRGDLVISTFSPSGCGAAGFLISGENRITLSAGCRQTPWGELQFDDASINDQGQVVFTAASYVDNQINQLLLFLYSGGELTLIVSDGDPTPAATTFSRGSLAQPGINYRGDLVFEGFSQDGQGREGADLWLYSNGEFRSLVTSGAPSPVGGVFSFVRLISSPQMNTKGEVLFYSSVLDSPSFVTDGLFIVAPDGIKKVAVAGDILPAGREVAAPSGSLNDKGEVAFISNANNLYTEQEAGIYFYSGGQIQKIMLVGEPTPIGGTFAPFRKADAIYPGPRLNSNSTMAFKAAVKNGNSPVGIFLASPRAIIKVVAVGDLIDGEKIAGIDTFALNDLGQIAFFALDKHNKTLGVFKAAPVAPLIESLMLKHRRGALELRVTGNAMITNDTVIEIDGVALTDIDYPTDSREDGGFTTRVVSRDPRLEQLIPSGQSVQVTAFNSLTNLRSAAKTLTR
jgi:hypothetical protein